MIIDIDISIILQEASDRFRACVESWLGQKGFEINISKVMVQRIADLVQAGMRGWKIIRPQPTTTTKK